MSQLFNPTNPTHRKFLDAVRQTYGDITTITREQCAELVLKSKNSNDPEPLVFPIWLSGNALFKTETPRVYRLPSPAECAVGTAPAAKVKDTVALAAGTHVEVQKHPEPLFTPEQEHEIRELIPPADPVYVPFGCHGQVQRVLMSKKFFPLYISGLSGCGKTTTIKEVCARIKRPFVRVNVTAETDEDDLLGGFRLRDGATVWEDGPVVKAMKLGAVLLLDEIDLGSSKIMCLQPVLEGNPIYLKKIKMWVKPAYGFNVIATANTKGKGDETGNFIGTGILNEAFLDRFSMAIDQEYPPLKTERMILENVLAAGGRSEPEWVQHLTTWADDIRKAYLSGTYTEIITTRRLVAGCVAYTIFGTKKGAMEAILTRFTPETKEAFLTLYNTLDPAKAKKPDPSAAKIDPTKIRI